LLELASAGLVIVLDAELSVTDLDLIGRSPASVVVMGTILPEGLRNAELILPVTTMAEENGTYVNRDRRIQRYTQAKSPPGMARPAWWVAGEVLAGPGPSAAAPATAAEAFKLLGERWPVFATTSYDDIGFTGRILSESTGAAAVHGSRTGVL
jgi:predicted molibdopterin-dependent oxidoreductase YjgC